MAVVDPLAVAEWRRRADAVPDRGNAAAVAFWSVLHAIADHADHGTGASAFPGHKRLAARTKRRERAVQDDVGMAEAVGLVVAKRRRNLPTLYQLAWPDGRSPADVANDLARLRAEAKARRPKKAWTGAPSAGPESTPGSAPRPPVQIGAPSAGLGSAPGARPGSAPGAPSGSAPAGAAYLPLTSKDQRAAAEPPPLLPAFGGEDEDDRLTDAELVRAVEHRVSEMRADGSLRNEGGLRRTLVAAFKDDPAEGRSVLARAADAAGPPVLSAHAQRYRARLLELADEAMALSEHGTAEALRLVARRIRETGEVPDETPEQVAESEREHRARLVAEEQVA